MTLRYDKNNETIWEYKDIHIFVPEDRRWAINRWSNVDHVQMPIALTHFCYRECHYENCWNYVVVPNARPWAMDPDHSPALKDHWRCTECDELAPDDLISVWQLLYEENQIVKPPPYDLVYQDGKWAIVDVSDYVKEAHRNSDVHPSYPWIMHWCSDAETRWNFASDAPPMPAEQRGMFCRECKEVPPDHILTIRELYK